LSSYGVPVQQSGFGSCEIFTSPKKVFTPKKRKILKKLNLFLSENKEYRNLINKKLYLIKHLCEYYPPNNLIEKSVSGATLSRIQGNFKERKIGWQ
jgi:hypothetical protein